ncbi:protein 60A [Parasteatoda tepidariorum]|uniref:protein 60A n=1 Tax=Parasteatoda tepidariorum TaxID=114398 RepID=UPI000A2C04CB|nr:protein 60A [Parasteatoda tepidariorum]
MALCLHIFVVIYVLIINEVFCLSGGFYADNGRQQSILLRPLRRKDKVELEHEILQLLGLHHRPNPKQHHDVHSSAPKYLIDLYKKLQKEEINSKQLKKSQRLLAESDFIVSFVNKIHEEYPHIRHERDKRYWFDTSQVPNDEELFTAEFRFYRNYSKKSSPRKGKYLVSLYSVRDADKPNSNTLELVDEMTINHQSGWLAFNVTKALVKWIAFPQKNLGLYLKIKTLDSSSRSLEPHEIGIAGSTGREEYQPFMVAYFKSANRLRIRTKRGAKKRQDNYYDDNYHHPYGYVTREKYSSKRNCQRSTLYVSFKDLGWEDWIIAPDGYGAFYCEGECSFPLNANMNATNHAIVQTLVHLMDPSVVPKPQCSPTQLTAITVLYFDNNSNVILKKYRNMVVKSCGCH